MPVVGEVEESAGVSDGKAIGHDSDEVGLCVGRQGDSELSVCVGK